MDSSTVRKAECGQWYWSIPLTLFFFFYYYNFYCTEPGSPVMDHSLATLSAVQMKAPCPQSSQPDSGTGDNRQKHTRRAGQVDSLWVGMNSSRPCGLACQPCCEHHSKGCFKAALLLFAVKVRTVWEKAQKCLFGVGREGWLEIEKDKGRRHPLSDQGKKKNRFG